MSETPTSEFDPRLLDLHLGHLSEAEQAELRGRIDADPRLKAEHEALQSVFSALGLLRDQPMPADLPARTMARVRAAGRPPRVVRPADRLTKHVERHSAPLFRLGRLTDVVAVAALVVLAVGLGLPGMLHLRERQQRLGCSYNLAQLGAGVQQYLNTYNASLPFAGWGPGRSWQPTGDPSVQVVPNRRHVYPLLLQAYVLDPRVFVCPSQPHVPMPASEVQRHDDFLEGRNVSYAYQNMAGVRPSGRDDPRQPILADENPLFDEGLPLFDARRLPRFDATRANSRAHGGAGQNILTLSGEVKWTITPLVGVNGDNIWTLHGVSHYTGREGPTSATDSHLLK